MYIYDFCLIWLMPCWRDKTEHGNPKFILADKNMTAHSASGGTTWGDVWLGKCIFAQAYNQGKGGTKDEGTYINPTGPPGFGQGIFHGMAFELGKDGWEGRLNVHEWMEISPVHPQYYQMTQQQRETLEARIKQGLASISQSVSDLELVDHDVRKYDEYMDYLKCLESDDELTKEKASFALKTVFVDTVDFHAGGGGQGAGRLSMAFMRNNNIMPTVVDDFMRMKSLEDINTGYLSKLPDVEKRMLETKWTLYEEWLKLFQSAVKKRLERIDAVKKSREFTLNEYREWLKPTILRYKLVEEALSHRNKGSVTSDMLKTHHGRTTANATSVNGWKFWTWKAMPDSSPHPTPNELYRKAIDDGEYGRPPYYDKWLQEELIFNKNHGLIADYPWITKEWADENANAISKGISGQRKPYYTFVVVDIQKALIRLASGAEVEDMDTYTNLYVMSPNILLAKQLELAAIKQEMDKYVDDVLGLGPCVKGKKVENYIKSGFRYKVIDKTYSSKKEMLKDYPENEYYMSRTYDYDGVIRKHGLIGTFLEDYLGLKFIFGYHTGPYERTFYERMTKFHFKYSMTRFDTVTGLILRRMKIGESAS